MHPERLSDALEEVVAISLRGRGRFWLASQPDTLLVWDSHQDLLMMENGGPWMAALPDAAMDLVSPARRSSALLYRDPMVGDRRQHLVFTGLCLDTVRLFRLLDSCLLDPAEEREWEGNGPPPADPFQPLFADSHRPDG